MDASCMTGLGLGAWERRQAVWNNTGDTAVLLDGNGSEVARESYIVANRGQVVTTTRSTARAKVQQH